MPVPAVPRSESFSRYCQGSDPYRSGEGERQRLEDRERGDLLHSLSKEFFTWTHIVLLLFSFLLQDRIVSQQNECLQRTSQRVWRSATSTDRKNALYEVFEYMTHFIHFCSSSACYFTPLVGPGGAEMLPLLPRQADPLRV